MQKLNEDELLEARKDGRDRDNRQPRQQNLLSQRLTPNDPLGQHETGAGRPSLDIAFLILASIQSGHVVCCPIHLWQRAEFHKQFRTRHFMSVMQTCTVVSCLQNHGLDIRSARRMQLKNQVQTQCQQDRFHRSSAEFSLSASWFHRFSCGFQSLWSPEAQHKRLYSTADVNGFQIGFYKELTTHQSSKSHK